MWHLEKAHFVSVHTAHAVGNGGQSLIERLLNLMGRIGMKLNGAVEIPELRHQWDESILILFPLHLQRFNIRRELVSLGFFLKDTEGLFQLLTKVGRAGPMKEGRGLKPIGGDRMGSQLFVQTNFGLDDVLLVFECTKLRK